ncbi:hypothetical protein [Burkholderia contaminans]|uniref:hypothetical protein n=1 Tax=Burkholderia contaminans TaxID=488447 RepID=UPI00162387A7|nr:hypothetical protein [Burkholderia contaminans]
MKQGNESESDYLPIDTTPAARAWRAKRLAQAAAIACSACDTSSAAPPMTMADPTTYRATSAGDASTARVFNIICVMIITPSTN